jgi:hypothetical protein
VKGGDAPWELTFHVLSSARFSLRSVRRLIFAERMTPRPDEPKSIDPRWLRSIRPTRARMGLHRLPNRSEKAVVFPLLSERGRVRAPGEPLFGAHPPIATWPKAGKPTAEWWNRSQPRLATAGAFTSGLIGFPPKHSRQ